MRKTCLTNIDLTLSYCSAPTTTSGNTQTKTNDMIEALDNVKLQYDENINLDTPKQCLTENGNNCYDWMCTNTSGSITTRALQERVVQFYFQATLCNSMLYGSVDTKEMQQTYHDLLETSYGMDCKTLKDDLSFYNIVIRLALQTRDIQEGKGMSALGCGMLECLAHQCYRAKRIPKTTFFRILKRWVGEFTIHAGGEEKVELPYGSWKDLRNFIEHIHASDFYTRGNWQFKLCDDILKEIYLPQMVSDRKQMSIQLPISLCGKWLPREHSKPFRSLARRLAKLYYKHVFGFTPATTSTAMFYYRKLCSRLNRYLDTTQVHMAAKQWDRINFENVTSQTLLRSHNAFINKRKINEEHREICKHHYESYLLHQLEKCNQYDASGNPLLTINAKTLLPNQLVSKSFEILHTEFNQVSSTELSKNNTLQENCYQRALLNTQWKALVNHVKAGSADEHFMKHCIACIDVSPSMYDIDALPLYSAIGMGIMTAECSSIKRAFTFSERPDWVRLAPVGTELCECFDFMDNVERLQQSNWGSTTNILAMFEMLLNTLVENSVSESEVAKYSLIIFSDMQFDQCCAEDETSVVDTIRRKFLSKGYSTIPYLVFWNLRKTNNFPTIEKTPYSTKLSGNSAALFKFFMRTDLESIKNMTNWTLIQEVLTQDRYDI